MTIIDIGDHLPCPCGSGMPFKMCCQGREKSGRMNETTAEVFAGLRQALVGRQFSTRAEAQAFVDRFVRQRNQAPCEDFHGLSPERLRRFLYLPFDSSQEVCFPERLETQPVAPILILFGLLTTAIGEQGLKPTATGNLPRNLCREAALAYWGEEKYRENTRFGGINREEDFIELHVARLAAELAGLIRKYRGRFILSRDCRGLLAESGSGGIYPRLLRAYVEQFNWGYWDCYPGIPCIQRAWLFTLYLLVRHGDDWRPQAFYEDAFLRAFPQALGELKPNPVFPPEQEIRSCYTLRTLVRFVGFLGLATVEPVATDKPYLSKYRVIKLPLLDEAVRFLSKG